MKWTNPEVALPKKGQKVIVVVRTHWDKRHMTVAEYIPPRTVLAEDFMDPDTDSDFFDVAEDGTEYTPRGWYEMPLTPDINYYISDMVEWWTPAPEPPARRGAARRAA